MEETIKARYKSKYFPRTFTHLADQEYLAQLHYSFSFKTTASVSDELFVLCKNIVSFFLALIPEGGE